MGIPFRGSAPIVKMRRVSGGELRPLSTPDPLPKLHIDFSVNYYVYLVCSLACYSSNEILGVVMGVGHRNAIQNRLPSLTL